MSLRGMLSLYPRPGQESSYPYFVSGAEGAENAVVFIGGLTNGLMNPGYLPDLSKALEGLGWQLWVIEARVSDIGLILQGADALVFGLRWLRYRQPRS